MTSGSTLTSTKTLRHRPRGNAPRTSQKAGSPAPGQTIRSVAQTLAMAAAIVGVAEVAIHRVASPIVTHIPGVPGGTGLSDAIRSSGEAVIGATAVLVPISALAVAVLHFPRHRPLAMVLAATVGATVGYSMLPETAFRLLSYLLLGVATIGIVSLASRTMPRLHAAGVAAAGFGFLAGMWPLFTDALGSSGIAARFSAGSSIPQTIAEATLVISAVLFAIATIRRGLQRRATWWVAASVGLTTAALLASPTGYAAVLSLWALGMTLTLPPIAYTIAAMSLAIVATEWLGSPSTRHFTVGIALIAVAGVAPAAVHHNLSAVIGLLLLSTQFRDDERTAHTPSQLNGPASSRMTHPNTRKES